MHMGPFKDIGVDLKDMVATIEIRRPPHNFFDIDLIRQIADACEALDKDSGCRAVVLAAQGTAFCAGAKLGDGADVLVPQAEVRAAAQMLAAEIAECSPLGVLETRATARAGLADRVRAATDIELQKQTRLRLTADFKEGVNAVNERRVPRFVGR